MEKTRLTAATIITSALILTGCAERGYQLTVQPATHTATAQQSSDLHTKSSKTGIKEIFGKMNKAVKDALTRTPSKSPASKQIPVPKQPSVTHTLKQKKIEAKKEIQKTKKALARAKKAEAEKEQELKAEKIRLARLEEKKRAEAEEIAKREAERKRAQQAAKTEAQKQKTLEAERIAKEKAAQKQKEILLQKEKIAKLKKEKEEQEKKQQALIAKKRQQEEEEKRRLAAAEAMKARKLKEALLKTDSKTPSTLKKREPARDFSSPIKFVNLNQTYQKFGTSEIHGHVIYLSDTGEELPIHNAKVYLLPVGANLNFWYQNFYLKNRNPGIRKIEAHYLNSTALDLDRNFAFYGVPAGNYYIIIEASHPLAKSKKIYIAKRIHIGKYKKVMAVFSKKL